MKRHGVIVSPQGDLGATFNPAAAKLDNGSYVLLVRSVPAGYEKIGPVNSFTGNYTSHISLFRADAPEGPFSLVNDKAITPDQPFDKYGAEDPRITKIGDTYYIFYTSIAKPLDQPDAGDGIRIAMASTKDFKTFEKHGPIGPDRRCKAGVIFESAGNTFFLWKDEEQHERTMLTPLPKNFDITDGAGWEKFWQTRDIEKDLLLGAGGKHEGLGVEPGAPPIEIEEGLVLAYSSISSDFNWTISLLLLDKTDPTKILAKSEKPCLRPEMDYELKGDVNNVVFPCGAVIDDERLYIYYGGADKICAVASESMDEVRNQLNLTSVERRARKTGLGEIKP
ncbi:MAG TPA: hypothetical protein VEF76_01285 [Patescibacteria group bacterium]|nr:hypothetical protein [Patescibacteria group bacterium]